MPCDKYENQNKDKRCMAYLKLMLLPVKYKARQ